MVAAWCLCALMCSSERLEAKQAYLVTYGVGEEVWEWFGHNAIWLRDEEAGLDHTFSFGYFDIEQAGFYWQFAKGQMRYFGSSVGVQREFAFYQAADRSIRTQRLDLNEAQFDKLYGLLTDAIYPYPQYYDYDYYLANCSTWLRDLLNQTLDDGLFKELASEPAGRTFRQHTAQMTQHFPLAHLGLMTLLGSGADRPISRWDEAFLPNVLADQLSEFTINGSPLVVEDQILFSSGKAGSKDLPQRGQVMITGFGLLFGLLVVLPLFWSRGIAWWPQQVTALVFAALGLVLFGFWFFTAHEITQANWMVAVLHPLWLGLSPIWPRWLQRGTWWLCLVGLVVAIFAWASSAMAGFGLGQSMPSLWLFFPIAVAVLIVSRRALWSGHVLEPKLAGE